MNKSFIIAVLAAMSSTISCGQKDVQPEEGSRTGFAISFFKSADDSVGQNENVIVSPYSAGVILSMLAEGADGETEVEIDNALNGTLFKAEETGSGDDCIALSSNSVWISDDFSVRNRYVNILEKDFDAFVDTQDFADPATVKAINNWCSEHTSGKITEIIDRLGPDMVMVLVNALYFNAPWEREFDPEATYTDVFHGRMTDTEVSMMAQKAMFNYAEYQGAQMIEIPYSGGQYSMYVVLPPSGMSPEAVFPYLNEETFDRALNMLSPVEVAFKMPAYKMETSLVLNGTLEKMGVRTAFSSAADFNGISVSGPLKLDVVKQKCYVDVNEKGTEAAAVTSAQIRLTSVRPVIEMKVDRPFFFMIADMEHDNILFAGKIVEL